MAEGDLARLVVTLEASTKAYERALAKAQGTSISTLRRIQKEGEAFSDRFGAALASSLSRLGAAVGGAFTGKAFVDAADRFTRIGNSLKVAGVSGGQLSTVMSQLYAIAQSNGVPLEALATLYGRVAQAQTTLKASSADVLKFTGTVAQALKVAGKSAEESSGALLQLGQALSGGKIQAEEYNSLIDGMYPLLQAAAAGLKEAGGDVSKLTALVKDGKVSSTAFFRAIEAGSPILGQKLAASADTVASAMTRFSNAATIAAGEIDQATGATRGLIGVLDALASRAGTTSQVVVAAANAIKDALSNGPKNFDIEYDALGNPMPNYRTAQPPPAPTYSTGGGFGAGPSELDMQAQREAARARALSRMPARINPVSLASFPVTDTKDKADKADAYDRQSDSIEKKIKLLEAEASAIGKTKFEQEKAKTVAELENSVIEAGLPLTAERRAEIDKLATSYANAAVRVDTLEKAQRDMIASLDAVRSTAGSTLGTFANDLAEGVKAADALKTAVDSIRTAILNALANRLVAALLGPSGAVGQGFLGSIFGGGRAAGGAMAPGREYRVGENGPERIVPMTRARVEPIAPVRQSRSQAAGTTIVYAPVSDYRGADAAVVARVELMQRAQSRQIAAIVGAPDGQRRGTSR